MTSAINRNGKKYHPDIIVFLFAIPLISAFNYYLTYSNIQLNAFLLLTFVIDTVQGYAAWWVVRSLIIWLDKRVPILKSTAKRLAIQIPTTTLAGLIVISLSTELVSFIAKGKSAPLSFYYVDLFIISIWFLVINGFYIGMSFYNEWKASIAVSSYDHTKMESGVVLKHGKMDVKVGFDELIGFLLDADYPVAITHDGKKYYLDYALDHYEKLVPPAMFFRLTRQHLVHRKVISAFKRIENGKLEVQLHHHLLPPQIVISRLRAPAFKDWFRA